MTSKRKGVTFFVFQFLLFFAFSGSAQNEMDSLQHLLATAPEDTNKVWIYRDLFKAHYRTDQVDEMISTAESGLDFSKKLGYPKGIDYMIYYLASALDIAGRGVEAIPLFEEGLANAQANGDEAGAADYFINLGVAHYGLGDYEKGIQNYMGAHDIYSRLGEKEKLAKVLNNIGIIYRTQEKFERAEEIYEQSFVLKKELGDSLGMAASWQNLAVIRNQLGKREAALSDLKKALEFYTLLDHPSDVASCQTTLGEIYLDAEMTEAAQSAFEEAWAYFEKNPEAIFTPITLQGLGQVALKEGDYLTAEKHFRRSLEMARSFDKKQNTLTLLRQLSTALDRQGKSDEAYVFLREAYTLQDSLTEEKKLSLMEEMQAKFDLTQKDNELKISQLELKERTQQRNFSIFGVLALALLTLSVFVGLRSKLKANKKLSEQKEELQKQRIHQLEQEKKLGTLSAMLEGEDKERSRIANDLHDSLGGLLASVKSHFNALKNKEEETPIFEKTNHLIDEAAVEVRRISHNMMPRALALSGLSGALEDLAQDLRQKGLDCELEIVGMEGVELPQNKTVNLFRIAQELTNNAVKHAGAKNLLLQLLHRDGALTLIVEDDGKGFDVAEAMKKKGLGLSSIASRVEFLQGEIDWDSVPGEGTTVLISVPSQ